MPKIPAIPAEAALAMASRAQQAARGAGDVRSAFGAKPPTSLASPLLRRSTS